MPTPPAAPCTSSRSPTVSPAWVKSASWAVVNASGTPPAAVQSSSSGTGIAARSCTTRELGLAAAADDRHHAVAELEAADAAAGGDHLAGELQPRDVGRRAGRRRVAALELEHVGAVEPRGADADEQLAAPRGSGSGCSATAISPSRIVAARMAAMLAHASADAARRGRSTSMP